MNEKVINALDDIKSMLSTTKTALTTSLQLTDPALKEKIILDFCHRPKGQVFVVETRVYELGALFEPVSKKIEGALGEIHALLKEAYNTLTGGLSSRDVARWNEAISNVCGEPNGSITLAISKIHVLQELVAEIGEVIDRKLLGR